MPLMCTRPSPGSVFLGQVLPVQGSDPHPWGRIYRWERQAYVQDPKGSAQDMSLSLLISLFKPYLYVRSKVRMIEKNS